jgi:hypothetical protein
MPKLIDAAQQKQRDGLAKAVAHVHRMYQQGLASSDDLERARMFQLTHAQRSRQQRRSARKAAAQVFRCTSRSRAPTSG